MTADVLDELESGARRAAVPDSQAPGGWRVDPSVKEAILACFADRTQRTWSVEEAFAFVDRAGLPPRRAGLGDARVVPGGTAVRAGVRIGRRVVVMPPSYVNVGAWLGDDTMIDSHVLVGSCAQVGARVHLGAGVLIGGVLEPPGARPVIVEDDAFVGAGSTLVEGVLVGARAVVGAGVSLSGTSRLYDLDAGVVHAGTPEAPLAVPADAVVVPGQRRIVGSDFADAHGLSLATAIVVKRRDARTDARTALELALR